MQEHTKKLPTDGLIPVKFMVHPSNLTAITNYVNLLQKQEVIPWRELSGKRGDVHASILRGARNKAEVTQTKLSELTGIPQRHISEMERGKRPIGKETAKKLAVALETDYRLFL